MPELSAAGARERVPAGHKKGDRFRDEPLPPLYHLLTWGVIDVATHYNCIVVTYRKLVHSVRVDYTHAFAEKTHCFRFLNQQRDMGDRKLFGSTYFPLMFFLLTVLFQFS